MRMNARLIKTAVMAWLRFGRQYQYVTTENGYFSADVLGSNADKLVEIEVKVSAHDLRNDFYRKDKHKIYKAQDEKMASYRWQWMPNQFYFAVPADLEKYAIEYTEKEYFKYGVLVMDLSGDKPLWDSLRVARRARALHKRPVDPDTLHKMASRMASDLTQNYIARCHTDEMMEAVAEFARKHIEIRDIDPDDNDDSPDVNSLEGIVPENSSQDDDLDD